MRGDSLCNKNFQQEYLAAYTYVKPGAWLHQCTSHTDPLLHIYKGPSWSGVGAFQKYSINMGFRHWAKTRQFFTRWGEGGPFALSTSEPVL